MSRVRCCPVCGNKLEKVTQSHNSMFNSEQFDSIKLGDYFCRICVGFRGAEYRYFWTNELSNPVILFREDRNNREELEVARQFFEIRNFRSECQEGDIVIGRYSVLPFYGELERDLINIGAKLINTHQEHLFIANFDYYEIFKDVTPETWREHEFPSSTYEGPFVVKGMTNSRKHQWTTHMFAKTRRDAILIACELHNDMLLGDQDILYRKYVPLKKLGEGINGLPFSNEWRFFALNGSVFSHGFYWSSLDGPRPELPQKAWDLVDLILKRMIDHNPFYSFDLAETESGDWILVEMNSGQMTGLSDVSPLDFYQNLREKFDENLTLL